MAKIPYLLEPGRADKVLTHSKYIQGSYIVVRTEAERDELLTFRGMQIGTLCYVSTTEKAYRYKYNKDTKQNYWEEESFKGSEFFEDLVLKEELKVYTNVGNVTGASPTNPVKIGEPGNTFKQAWNVVFGPKDTPAAITAQPSISVSITPSGTKEFGTSITQLTLDITRNNGQYNYYGTGISTTGVQWNNDFEIEATISKGSNTVIYTTASNAITKLSDNRYTFDLTKTILESRGYEAGITASISVKVTQSHTEAENYAYSLLGLKSDLKINAGEKTQSKTFSLSSTKYIYYGVTENSTTPVDNTTNKIISLQKTTKTAVAGTYSFNPTNQYLWIAIPNDLTINKIVWNGNKQDLDSDYRLLETKAITLDTGVSYNYKFYQFVGAKTGSFEYVVS